MKSKRWFMYALGTTAFWGVWGALIEIPEKAGFPATLGYSAWALTMIPIAIIALKIINWRLDRSRRNILLGIGGGLAGCGGQLILFQCLRMGPAYIVFPIISLYPVVTIILSVLILKEKASKRSWIGIILALFSIGMLSYQPPSNSAVKGSLWLLLAVIVFIMWGLQAFIMKFASDNNKKETMQAESVTFYTMLSAVSLIPVALLMTDFSMKINWGFSGVYSAGLIQSLNAIGFLFFAYAIRYGKAIIVVPLMSLAPVVTVIISLVIYSVIPQSVTIAGMVLAFIAIYLLAE
jgi:drug/metabolite transporter (DMT)-like permease